jgi:hypothetical protein
LSGIAALLLWNTEHLSYESLINKLRDRFGEKGMEEKFKNELRCRRRPKGESIRELAQDVRRLMTLAYPGEQSSLSEHIARDAFLSALDEPDMELKIREREAADFDSAVKLAQLFEVFKTTVDDSSGIRQRVNRQIVEADQGFKSRIEKLEDQLHCSALHLQTKANASANEQASEVESRAKSDRNRAVNNKSTEWKNEMVKKIGTRKKHAGARSNQTCTQSVSTQYRVSPKQDSSFCCCVDYRQLNSVTRKDAYPLPRIDACHDAMASAQWFSTFDQRSSYHQVKVDTRDFDKTAFICPRGMYRF